MLPGSSAKTDVATALPSAAGELTATLGQEGLEMRAPRLNRDARIVLHLILLCAKLAEVFDVKMKNVVDLAAPEQNIVAIVVPEGGAVTPFPPPLSAGDMASMR